MEIQFGKIIEYSSPFMEKRVPFFNIKKMSVSGTRVCHVSRSMFVSLGDKFPIIV